MKAIKKYAPVICNVYGMVVMIATVFILPWCCIELVARQDNGGGVRKICVQLQAQHWRLNSILCFMSWHFSSVPRPSACVCMFVVYVFDRKSQWTSPSATPDVRAIKCNLGLLPVEHADETRPDICGDQGTPNVVVLLAEPPFDNWLTAWSIKLIAFVWVSLWSPSNPSLTFVAPAIDTLLIALRRQSN